MLWLRWNSAKPIARFLKRRPSEPGGECDPALLFLPYRLRARMWRGSEHTLDHFIALAIYVVLGK